MTNKWHTFVFTLFSWTVLVLLPLFADAGQPINVHVTLRGKKYDIPNVSTVNELQQRVEEQSGLLAAKQGVLYGGQKLKPSDVLEDVGVEEGSVINIVPSSTKKKKSTPVSSSSLTKDDSASVPASSETNGAPVDAESVTDMMEEAMKQAGIDSEQFQEMMNSMMGGEGGGDMPDMMQSMEMMQQMINSPMFQEYFNDPERLEQSRQMILQNPMMKEIMGSLPGFEDILNDEVKWRETMMAAAKMYQDLGNNMMNPDMMNSMAGFGMEGTGIADTGATASVNSALNELSEGDEE